MPHSVAIVVGSLRKESFNRKAAKALIAVAPPSLTFDFVEIDNLHAFNEDLEATPPQPWLDFRNQIKPKDAVLFFTPEYNRSVPGVLKNAIDVGSRPYGSSVWNNKPAGVLSGSVAPTGGFGANHHLRQSLAYLNMHTLAQPEAYLGSLGGRFNAAGEITDDKLKETLTNFAKIFAAWVELHRK